MAVDDGLRAKLRAASSIRELIDNPTGQAVQEADNGSIAAAETLSPLPRPGDPYQAHARATNKPVLTLHFLMASAAIRGFSYANLDSIDLVPGEKPGDGPVIVIRFAGITATEAILTGRHLDRLYNQIGQHRIAWVCELPPRRDFKEAGEAVINRITIQPFEQP